MPKLNLGKVVGDKGDPFVFEDFTPEQLDGLTPKMLKGNVTTLDPDQNATVDIRKEGLNNYIDFGIPRGLNGSEIQSISAENVEMADGDTLEKAMAAANENIARIEEPIFDDTTDACNTLTEFNNAAEAASNAIQSHTSIFSTLSNMKKSLSAIVQGLKILGSNVGGIHGISSALDSQEEDIAASSKAVSVLNSNLGKIMSKYKLLKSSATSGTVNIPFTDYRMLYLCILDSTNNIILAADTINVALLLALGQSNVGDYIAYHESESVKATLTVKVKAKESLQCNLTHGNFYVDGRLFYYIYGVN